MNFHHLLFLCSIVYQGIIGTLSDVDVKQSSDLLVREKRVINLEPGGHVPTLIENVPYMVNIQENGRSRCVGVILSNYNVITAERCILFQVTSYKILSGAGYTHRGATHNVTTKVSYFGNVPHAIYDGITLLTVDPLFVHNRRTQAILLYQGPLYEGTESTISGWGCQYPLVTHSLDRKLRSITLPLMNLQECADSYRERLVITYKNLCTYHPQKMCTRTDPGAPLVVHNKLAGIHVYKGETAGHINPDVYINLQSDEYRQWIENNAFLI